MNEKSKYIYNIALEKWTWWILFYIINCIKGKKMWKMILTLTSRRIAACNLCHRVFSSRWCLIRAGVRAAPCHFARRVITIIDFRSKMHQVYRFEKRFFTVRATLDDIIARQQIMTITLMTSITTARHIGLNHFRCAMFYVDTFSSAIESFRFCNLDKIQDRESRERITFLLREIWIYDARSCPDQCRAGPINYL